MVSPPAAYPVDPGGWRRRVVPYLEATLTARHLAVGRWTATALLNEHTAKVREGWRMVFDGGPLPGFGGTVDDIDIKLGDDSAPTRQPPTITWSGPDEMTVLEDRLAYPNPALSATAQDRAYDIRAGVGSTVVRDYINANAGPIAIEGRRTPKMPFVNDPVVGDTVSGKARFDPLLSEIVAPLAEQAGLRVWITSTTSGTRTVHIAQVQTVAKARFSLALRNLMSIRYRKTAPTATYMIGGGRGEETARDFVVQQDPAATSAWRYREDFYDYRNASDTDGLAELTNGTAKRLAESAAVEQVDVVPIDTQRLRFGRDYQLGDRVTVEVGHQTGITLSAVVREVEVTIQRQSGQPLVKVKPKVGTQGATGLLKSQQQLADVLARLGRLERR